MQARDHELRRIPVAIPPDDDHNAAQVVIIGSDDDHSAAQVAITGRSVLAWGAGGVVRLLPCRLGWTRSWSIAAVRRCS
jgi:hypothetical protein